MRLFAPFLPFVTEEVWSWWHDGSVHAAAVADGRRSMRGGDAAHARPGQRGAGRVRRAKTEAKLSQRASVDELVVSGPPDAVAAIEACRTDLAEAGGIKEFTVSDGADGAALVAEVRLTPAEPSTVSMTDH